MMRIKCTPSSFIHTTTGRRPRMMSLTGRRASSCPPSSWRCCLGDPYGRRGWWLSSSSSSLPWTRSSTRTALSVRLDRPHSTLHCTPSKDLGRSRLDHRRAFFYPPPASVAPDRLSPRNFSTDSSAPAASFRPPTSSSSSPTPSTTTTTPTSWMTLKNPTGPTSASSSPSSTATAHTAAVMMPLLQQAGVEWEVLMEYAQQRATPVRLADMVRRYTNAELRLQNAQFLHREIPVRVAHRIVDLLTLPHGLGTVPPIQQVALTYLSYLPQFQALPLPTTAALEEDFTDFLQTLVLDRQSVPTAIAAGVQEWLQAQPPLTPATSSSSRSTNPQDEMEQALYRFFTARVGLRLLTEHHVLTSSRPAAQELLKVTSLVLSPPDSAAAGQSDPGVVGCIHRNVHVVREATRVADLVQKQSALYCRERQLRHHHHQQQQQQGSSSSSSSPQLQATTTALNGPEFEIIDCHAPSGEATREEFTFVPHHLHYMLAELLKNSSRATIHRYVDPVAAPAASSSSLVGDASSSSSSPHHFPLAASESIPQSALQRAALKAHPRPDAAPLRTSTMPPIQVIIAKGAEDVTIKIADKAGGIPRSKMASIWKFAHSTAPADESESDLGRDEGTGARIRGFGLPLARIYARYFGGELTLKSTEGHGLDAYLYLPRLGTACENLPLSVQTSPGEGDSLPAPHNLSNNNNNNIYRNGSHYPDHDY